jgi:hypothetical protein
MVLLGVLTFSVRFLVTHDTKNDQILGSVIAQSTPRLNMMDVKVFHPPAPLATPGISLQELSQLLVTLLSHEIDRIAN